MTFRQTHAWMLVALLAVAQPAAAATVAVHSGDNLQMAITAANCGDVLQLDVGATFSAGYTLVDHDCTGPDYITIESASCPVASGQRATRADTSGMATISTTSGVTLAIKADPGAGWYRLRCFFVTATDFTYALVQLGTTDPEIQSTVESIPHHFILERMVLWVPDGVDATRGVHLNSDTTTISDSYIGNIKVSGGESQAIGCLNGPGHYVIRNNFLEAANINFICGGSEVAVPNLVPDDIVLENNTLSKNLDWVGAGYVVKNLFEVKCATNVTLRSNILQHSWVDGQQGQAILITPRGWPDPGAWCHVQHVTIEKNIITDVCQAFNVIGTTDGEGGDVTLHDSQDLVIQDNLFQMNLAGSGRCNGSDGKFMVGGLSLDDVKIRRNTIISFGSPYYMTWGDKDGGEDPTGFEFIDNVMDYGSNPFIGESMVGTAGLDAEFGAGLWTWTGNCIGGPAGVDGYPTGNGNVYLADTATWQALFVDWAGGNYRLLPSGVCEGKGVDFSLLPGQSSGSGKIRLRFTTSE